MATQLYMRTLGCPKNRVDSEIMLGTLWEAGFRLVGEPELADVIVVNTCGFIESAKEESIQAILALARMKEEGRCRKLVVAGCLAQRYPEELSRAIPEVDHLVGTGAYPEIARIVCDAQAKRIVVPDPDFVHRAGTPRVNSLPAYTAYVKVSEGCDNSCAFCIIPKLRGPQRSRPVDDVVREAEILASQGTVELSLVAQDLTAYGQDLPEKVRLHELLKRLCRVDGIRWIRLHYAYPRDFPDPLIDVIAGEPKIAKYVDMPLQHSSDRLLRSMKRGRDVLFLRRLLAKLRDRVPGIALRTALIVGLPGETEEDFEGLLRFVEEQRFERLGVFTYSREEGTAAADLPGQVPEKLKRARQKKVMELQRRISRAYQQALVGARLQVLIEGRAEDSEHLLAGRHSRQAPEIDGLTYVNAFEVPGAPVAYPGEMVTVEVTQAGDYDLVGKVVARETAAGHRPGSSTRAKGAQRPALRVVR